MSQKTLRDEFAMVAMQADLANPLTGLREGEDAKDLRERAEFYYRLANAMCDARDRTKRSGKVHAFRRKDDPKPPEQP